MKFSYIPKQLNQEELQAYEEYVTDAFHDADGLPALRRELYLGMINHTPEQIFAYKDTYVRWYAKLAWRRLHLLDMYEMRHVLENTFLIAILEEERIMNRLAYWLMQNTTGALEMGIVYNNMFREPILASKEILYMENNTPFTVADLFRQITMLENKDSLEQAEYFTKVGKRWSDNLAGTFYDFVDVSEIVPKLVGTLKTLNVVDERSAHAMSTLLVKPERFFRIIDSASEEGIAKALGVDMTPDTAGLSEIEIPTKNTEIPEVETVSTDFSQELALHKHDFPIWILEEKTLQLLLSWMKSFGSADIAHAALATELKHNLPKELDDETATMLLQVDTFLRNNNFGSKKDMVYFNEETGTFSWS